MESQLVLARIAKIQSREEAESLARARTKQTSHHLRSAKLTILVSFGPSEALDIWLHCYWIRFLLAYSISFSAMVAIFCVGVHRLSLALKVCWHYTYYFFSRRNVVHILYPE